MRAALKTALVPLMAIALSGCAGMGLEQVLQAPTFRVDSNQQAQLRLLGPSLEHPVGGAAVRLYARVGNPNPVGLTLTRLVGQLQLQGSNAARIDFPLGVPLQAGAEALVPIEIAIDFNDIPGLANVARNALTGQPINYSLNGTVGVDAGLLGQPSFGPMQLLSGELRAIR
ncbi:MAG TPA: LEA type 2 family protein [Longimicrobium sp.]|nr:LEA type 2 family protein [Longimicrobium sp.]